MCIPLHADVLVEAEIPVSFQINNTSDFTDYQFFYRYQITEEDGSGKTIELPIVEGKTYSMANGAEAVVVAKNTNHTSTDLIANRMVGGIEVTTNQDVKSFIEVIKITSLEEETFALKAESQITNYSDGTTQKVNLASTGIFHFKVPETNTQMLGFYIFTPILIVIGLFLLQRKRRAQLAKSPLGRIVNLKNKVLIEPDSSERVVSE